MNLYKAVLNDVGVENSKLTTHVVASSIEAAVSALTFGLYNVQDVLSLELVEEKVYIGE
jgi:hypothetical protein